MTERSRRRAASGLAALVLGACANGAPPGSAPATGQRCTAQIVVTFTSAPTGDLRVTELAQDADVELTFLREAGPGLYVYTLATDEADPACAAALARLRADPHVRSADVDARRGITQ